MLEKKKGKHKKFFLHRRQRSQKSTCAESHDSAQHIFQKGWKRTPRFIQMATGAAAAHDWHLPLPFPSQLEVRHLFRVWMKPISQRYIYISCIPPRDFQPIVTWLGWKGQLYQSSFFFQRFVEVSYFVNVLFLDSNLCSVIRIEDWERDRQRDLGVLSNTNSLPSVLIIHLAVTLCHFFLFSIPAQPVPSFTLAAHNKIVHLVGIWWHVDN